MRSSGNGPALLKAAMLCSISSSGRRAINSTAGDHASKERTDFQNAWQSSGLLEPVFGEMGNLVLIATRFVYNGIHTGLKSKIEMVDLLGWIASMSFLDFLNQF